MVHLLQSMENKMKNGKNLAIYKGYEELNGQYISMLKCGAKNRNIEWSEELTPEFLWKLFIKQERKCKLTGLELNFETYRNKQKGMNQSASLDRIDSIKGYIVGNIQWVHKDVNKIKNNFTEERFFELCNLINDNNKEEL